MKPLPLLLLLGACQAPVAAWNAPAQDDPVLCGTVTDPQGGPLGNDAGEWDFYVGVCVGSIRNGNPAELRRG
ncbi:MAG: hypothetical protein O3A20_09095 [Planctomycetota bacterium]|nr:hypothetical protein [Planctomycetota bacterium]